MSAQVSIVLILCYCNSTYLLLDENIGCSLSELLIFFTACDRIPPLQFESTSVLTFLHKGAKLPTSSTCDCHLRLPATYTTYNDFKEAMVLAIKCNDGFGGV